MNSVPGYAGGSLVYAGGLLFSTSGNVFDPINLRRLGAYSASGLVAADANAGRVYFLSGNTLLVFDLTTFTSLGQIILPIDPYSATKIVACGTNGVAVATADNLLLIRSRLFPPLSQTDLVTWQSTDANVGIVGSNFTYSITVSNAGPAIATNAILADLLPADATLALAANSQGACSFTNGILRCGLGTLAPGDSITTTVVVQPGNPDEMVNLAWVLGSETTQATSRQTNSVVFDSVLPAVTRLWLNADNLAYDSKRNLLWISTERFGGAVENNLRSISLTSGASRDSFAVGYPLGPIALSADQNYLYAVYVNNQDGLNYTPDNYLRRLNLNSAAFDEDFVVADALGQQDSVVDLIGLANYPSAIVAARGGANGNVAIYENGSAILTTPSGDGPGKLEVNPSINSRLYMLEGGYGQDSFVRLSVGAGGITELPGSDLIALPVSPDNPTTSQIRYGGGLLFSDIGMVANPEALTNVTRLPAVGPVQTIRVWPCLLPCPQWSGVDADGL